MTSKNIFEDELRIINIGLEIFADELRSEAVEVVQMDWRPPTGGNSRLTALLAGLDDDD
jgi:hypothetical protein